MKHHRSVAAIIKETLADTPEDSKWRVGTLSLENLTLAMNMSRASTTFRAVMSI